MPTLVRKWVSYLKAAGLLKQMILEGSHQPEVLDKAAQLISDLPVMDYPAEAQMLWSYVQTAVRYVEDPHGDDHFQGPAVTMQRAAGDCDDQTILLGSLLRSIGFPVRVVFVFNNPPRDYTVDFPEHVYLEVDVTKNGIEPMWVCADTIPLPRNRGFNYAVFGEDYPAGYREFLVIE